MKIRPAPLKPGAMSRRQFVASATAAALSPALLSCGRTPTEVIVTAPRLTARPGLPTLEPTYGLNPLGLETSRDGILYVPESYTPDAAMPLIVVLHGAGGSGVDWQSYYARAEARGMIVLAPDSRGSTWDIVLGQWGPDVRFLDRALQQTFDHFRIDPTHLALGGFSDGASDALSVGLSNGDLFTHLIAYSPGFIVPAEPIVGTPRVYVSHGTGDQVLPVKLSRDGIVPDLRKDGYDVTFNEFSGGHEVPKAVSEAALDWYLGGL